jgi:ABC-2 type transport system ATP-binding protein
VSILQARQLEKIIDHRLALSIPELDLAEGEIAAIVGSFDNQSSLLIELLSGQKAPSRGSVLLDGVAVQQSLTRARIGLVLSDDLLYKRHSARANLKLYAELHSLTSASVDEALAEIGLSDQALLPVAKLSPSLQRRVAFARALLARPTVLLLDQPIYRADIETQILFERILTERAASGVAILMTDENLAWPARFCTRIIEMEGGRIMNTAVPIRTATTSDISPTDANGSASDAPQAVPTPSRYVPFKIPGRRDDRIIFFDPGDILYAMSRDGHTVLRTSTEEASTNLTLQELEQRLIGQGFFKSHRAYLVNLQHIKAVIQYTRNSYTLQLDDAAETMVPLSKQSEKELQELLRY